MKAAKEKKEKDDLIRKIEQLYQNYGIDISTMEDDEIERLHQKYSRSRGNIDRDLKESEKHKNKFIDDLV